MLETIHFYKTKDKTFILNALTPLFSEAVWDIVMFAEPAAIIGGIAATTIATYINTKTLKTVLGILILVMGLLG